jgi:50S ribosomal subunit-associated GTPase HflX
MDDPRGALESVDEYERAVPISALYGQGVPSLLSAIEIDLNEQLTEVCVEIPYQSSRLISLFHELGLVDHQEHRTRSVVLSGRLPKRYLQQYNAYIIQNDE